MSYWGLFTAAGAVTAVLWLLQHRGSLGLTQNEFWAGIWTLVIGGIGGAKLLFLILGWNHYARGELRFWADFGVGYVFFGGLIGAVAASLIFARVRRLNFMKGADYFAVAIPIGHSIGRIGCFLTGCCAGRPPHIVQLYESLGLALIAWLCRCALKWIESGTVIRGTAFSCYLILYGFLRILLDPLRADGRPERFLGLSHQQLIALLVVAVSFIWYIRHLLANRSCAHKRKGSSQI